MSSLIIASVGLLIAIGAFLYYGSLGRKANLPPGPTPLPIIGNLFDIPSGNEVHVWAEWRKRWGPLNSVTTFGTTIVVANSYKKAFELCEKKSHIYSDRAQIPMAGDLVGWKDNLAFKPYGTEFRYGRKVYHQEFGTVSSLVKFQEAQDKEASDFLRKLLERPQDFDELSAGLAGGQTMRVAYGYETVDPKFVSLVNKVMDTAGVAAAPSSFLVNMIPILKYVPSWFPGASFRRQAQAWRNELYTMNQIPWDFVKAEMAKGSALDSFSSRMLSQGGSSSQDDYHKWLAAGILVGGTDTSYGSILSYFAAMLHNSDVQKKAQAEIEKVVGLDRLPTFADRTSLPYVGALLKEIYRCYVVGPLGIPHMSNADDHHDGYFIPKGSIVFTNIWLIAHDPEVYTDPFKFNPDRFLGDKPEQDPLEFAFGFGRRICPGRFLADAAIWITVAKLLSVFDVLQPISKDTGKPYLPAIEMTPGLVSHPKHFDARIVVRNTKALSLIHSLS